MIKRLFYKQEHGEGGGADSSSSSSDSAPESDEEKKQDAEEEQAPHSPSLGSGYESEDSSANELEADPSGSIISKEDQTTERGEIPKESQLVPGVSVQENNEKVTDVAEKAFDPNDPMQAETANYILKCKSVFRCKLCPRIICLNEDTVRTHLRSKRHARSKKLLWEGRLKLMLNSDGEIEEEKETHAERHARTLAFSQQVDASVKNDKGNKQKKQTRKKQMPSEKGEAEKLMKNRAKRRRKNGN